MRFPPGDIQYIFQQRQLSYCHWLRRERLGCWICDGSHAAASTRAWESGLLDWIVVGSDSVNPRGLRWLLDWVWWLKNLSDMETCPTVLRVWAAC